MALFNNYIQAGRVAIGRFHDVADTPCVVVDIVSLTRVIVVIPGKSRVLIPIRRLLMTPHKLDIPRGASQAEVEEALKSNDVIAQLAESESLKFSRQQRVKRSLNDFDRFRVSRALEAIAQQ